MAEKTETWWVVVVSQETADKEYPLLKERVRKSETVEVDREGNKLLGHMKPTDLTISSNIMRSKVLIGQHSREGDKSVIIDKNDDETVRIIGETNDGDFVDEKDREFSSVYGNSRIADVTEDMHGLRPPCGHWD